MERSPKVRNGGSDFTGYREVSEQSIEAKLFQIIDDIDTAGDMFKPDPSPYERYVCKKVREARKFIESDGYKLFYVEKDDITVLNRR